MTIRLGAIRELSKLLGTRAAVDAIALAKKQDALESNWKKQFKAEIDLRTQDLLNNAEKTGKLNFKDVDFTDIVMEHSFEVMKAGIVSTSKPVQTVKLGPPTGKIPTTLKNLRIWWDNYRKRKKVPPRQKAIAEKLKQAYVRKLQSVWEKYGEEFREGETASKSMAIKAVKDGADVAVSRAEMIVDTETTYYYNKARREVYDSSDDVTHYLFMPIRDHATTKWCESRRSLVYAKSDPILKKETPPIHWRCRSELLPLTPLNPNHLKLIEDKSKWRRNNACEPLPVGWTSR